MKSYLYTNKDGRSRLIIKDDNGKLTTKSYPRILMEEKLGRPLEPYEDVHHVDGNPRNNNISNLEIKIHGEHQREHAIKYFDKEMICPVCDKTFVWKANSQRNFYMNVKRGKTKNKLGLPFCSKRCTGTYGKQEQLKSNFKAECRLNGEPSPNGNTVPISEEDSSSDESV